MFIPKYINTTCPVCTLLLVCIFRTSLMLKRSNLEGWIIHLGSQFEALIHGFPAYRTMVKTEMSWRKGTVEESCSLPAARKQRGIRGTGQDQVTAFKAHSQQPTSSSSIPASTHTNRWNHWLLQSPHRSTKTRWPLTGGFKFPTLLGNTIFSYSFSYKKEIFCINVVKFSTEKVRNM